jgi:hypothetical protein
MPNHLRNDGNQAINGILTKRKQELIERRNKQSTRRDILTIALVVRNQSITSGLGMLAIQPIRRGSRMVGSWQRHLIGKCITTENK